MDRVSQMHKIQQECLDIFKQKNHDYGEAFANHGPVGVLVRIGDKLNRFQHITTNGIHLVNDESLRDTLLDLHNYAAMCLLLLDEKKSIN